ncbi:MAG: tRNA (adenosine(37)-N6)-threonylcarbamoyltransferase complex ATPase subunit type 1 TsaE [Ideonella sp.]|nr:tRNA (adenosine(37)-N6)-threonylcarbamoyltransferase complex ATPase subunit type 1 TsaE [Ideonella sp.]
MTHTPILETRTQHWPDESSCEAFAASLARHMALANATVELKGTLGAGKTTLVRHLLRAMGVQGRIKSPTYAVVELYEVERPSLPSLAVSHFDFYRFESPDEWEDAGFRELFAAPGLKLCEWAEKVAGRLPTPDLRIHVQIEADDSRAVTLQALTPLGQELLQ